MFIPGITQAKPVRLDELPIQYADYSLWQQETMGGATLKNHLDYWKGKLAGAPPAIALPISPTHLSPNAAQGECRSSVLPKALKADLEPSASSTAGAFS